MAKPVITDKPIIDQAEFNGVTIWRKEGGSIEVSDTNYPSMKAAIQDIAAKAGVALDAEWNTQYAGWYLIQQLNKNESGGKVIGNKNVDESIDSCNSNQISAILTSSLRLKDYFFEYVNNSSEIESLSVSGQIDAEDFEFIKILAQSYESFKTLDLSKWETEVIEADQLRGLQYIESIVLPMTVKKIMDGALSENEKLKNIVWPAGLEILEGKDYGTGVFDACDSLERVELPKSLKKIGKSAFARCKNLLSITIPEGVESIEKWAFFLNISLTSLVLPSTVKSIGGGAFNRCRNLKQLELLSRKPPVLLGEWVECMFNSRDYPEDNPPLTEILIPKGSLPYYKMSDWANLGKILKEVE